MVFEGDGVELHLRLCYPRLYLTSLILTLFKQYLTFQKIFFSIFFHKEINIVEILTQNTSVALKIESVIQSSIVVSTFENISNAAPHQYFKRVFILFILI